jgi:hypothetical protein
MLDYYYALVTPIGRIFTDFESLADRLIPKDVVQLRPVNPNSFQPDAKVLQSDQGQRQETSRSPAIRFIKLKLSNLTYS